MDFPKQKLSLYKQITHQTYATLAPKLGASQGTLYSICEKQTRVLRLDIIEKFQTILDTITIKLAEEGTLWPELFFPRLTNVAYAFFGKMSQWYFVTQPNLPVLVDNEWYSRSDTKEGYRLDPIQLNSTIRYMNLCPWYDTLSREYSLLRQTEEGWVKVNPFPWDLDHPMLYKNGRHHIPGDYTTNWIAQIFGENENQN